jgi:hypothetical protein
MKSFNNKMKSFTKVLGVTSVALSMLIGSEAGYAQNADEAHGHNFNGAPAYRDVQPNDRAQGHPVIKQPNDVVSGNRVIGRDPDPFIRGEMLRHFDSSWPD